MSAPVTPNEHGADPACESCRGYGFVCDWCDRLVCKDECPGGPSVPCGCVLELRRAGKRPPDRS